MATSFDTVQVLPAARPEGGLDRSPDELHELLDRALDEAVKIATGNPEAEARDGQRRLSHDMLNVMLGRRHLAGEAPTGSGKSLAALTPALLLAACVEERTVVSTETLGLQEQYLSKDAPVVVEAVSRVLDLVETARPKVAVLKGWANTACSVAVCSTISELTGDLVSTLEEAQFAAKHLPLVGPEAKLGALAGWALEQLAAEAPADRGSFPEVLSADEWEQVSVSPAECPGPDRCRLGDTCAPDRARQAAADSDVIVTNHSMLATQAAKAVPVVIGSNRLGPVDHLVVDEAHALASKVRDQGATSINAFRVLEVARSVGRAVVETTWTNRVLADEANLVATALDERLAGMLPSRPARGGQARLFEVPPDDDDPLGGVGGLVLDWLARSRRLMPRKLISGSASPTESTISLWRAAAKIDTLAADLSEAGACRSGMARWVEEGRSTRPGGWSGATLKLSAVNAAGPLRSNLYEVGARPDSDGGDDETGGAMPMSVTLISATLPTSTVVDSGLSAATRKQYPSPFASAYDRSVLFVPRPSAGAGGAAAVTRSGGRGFDTSGHSRWALPLIEALVSANSGSALVLAATVTAGKQYVEALRAAAAGWVVHSQWDGLPVGQVVAQWRADHSSVLVGTKSLMTGVDAPGGTCSLVIVDRVPRAAGNPVDDARVADISERLEMDRWGADRFVYVSDACLLLEQAAGRLIRSVDDHGVVAVLDPRLLKVGGVSYPEPTRKALLAALGRFPHRSADLGAVCARMREAGGR